MPTVLRWNGFRFYFFSHEGSEPPHIHVDKAGKSAKFWLDPVSLARNRGYTERQLNRLHIKVVVHQDEFLQEWHEYFGHGG